MGLGGGGWRDQSKPSAKAPRKKELPLVEERNSNSGRAGNGQIIGAEALAQVFCLSAQLLASARIDRQVVAAALSVSKRKRRKMFCLKTSPWCTSNKKEKS